MKRPIILAAGLTTAAALVTAGLVLTRQPTPPRPAQPPLVLPAVDRFAPGACRDAADAVLSLARLTHGREVTELSAADRAELRRVQDRLAMIAPGADEGVAEQVNAVIVTVGYLRLRLDSRTAEPRYLTEVETARSLLEKTCVSA
ncbi:hypothetical protein [Actinoplanes utahensis]|uniref:Uncharacterized protein n=1 Tax=Actinoplanes utahensis TaxID=1869 RepID=A0A0A6URP9_ACTUT|nr:hypothetical protein [Actinoplanes utahensis]KHD78116.1 hypothetical protein MB27_06440 [Actinoplanes utahensis]GIF30583.1 hypothetical protein Aut01nite_35690 [Actinoplanes utahensis]